MDRGNVGRGGLVWVLAVMALAGGRPVEGQERPQGSAAVVGRVVAEEGGAPVGTAPVELLSMGDSSQVATAVTDAGGRFRLERIPEGVFFVRIQRLGYGRLVTQSFEVAAAELRNLGDLLLRTEALAMEPITVSAERSPVTYTAEGSSWTVGVMPGTQGTSVTETLSMIPDLEVDIDGNVTLRGETVTILINGRETPMTGEALTLFLEQFPADYLATINVVDAPSARYGAGGTGGIIDLVLKEGVDLGVSGSVFANAGTRGQYGVGGRGTLQRGDLTLNGGAFLRLSDRESSGYDLRQNLVSAPPFLRQDSRSDRTGLSNSADLGLRWHPSDAARFQVEGRVSGSGNESSGLTTTTHLDEDESPILRFGRSRDADSRNLSFDLSGSFDYEWERRRHELEIEVEVTRGWERSDSRQELTETGELVDGILIPAELTLEEQDAFRKGVGLQVDYTRPLGEDGGMEVGYDLNLEEADDAFLVRLVADGEAPEGELSDRGYSESETRHSAYATLRRAFGALNLQAGVRAEHSDRGFELPDGRTFGQRRTDLFPSASMSWRMEGDRFLRLSYSQRVNRPGFQVLNPVDRSTDPANRRVGNPDIEPQFTHRVSLDLNWPAGPGRLRLSPHYSTTQNGWAELTRVDADGVSTRTWENIASRTSYGASVTWSLRQRGGWRTHLTLSGRREVRDAGNLDDRYSGASFLVSSRANVQGPITEQLSAQGNFSYTPPTDLPQGRRDARYRADLGMRYRLLDDRASLGLSLADPFGLRRSSSRLRDLDYILVGRSEESTRSARISFSYTLGGGGGRGGR